MTDEIRRALCKHNKDNPSLTQKQLQEWVHSNYGLQVSQATISNTVKRSLEYLSLAPERGDVKRHKPAKFPDLEKSLYEWILQYQEHVNMTGELMEGMEDKLKSIRDKVDQFEMKDIFNTDET
ncbi:CENP-B homolog protein 2-like protein, partial [Tanacetum coccineum]